jgi:hypothetical protein
MENRMRKASTKIPEKNKPESRFVAPVNVPNARAESATVAAYFQSEHGAKISERDFFGTRSKEIGRKIVPDTAEVDYLYVPRIDYDIYDMRAFYEQRRKYFARSPGGDVDAMDHHQEPAHHLAGQRGRADAIRADEAPHPTPDCRTMTDGLSGALTRQATSCSVMDPIAELGRTSQLCPRRRPPSRTARSAAPRSTILSATASAQ